MFVTPTQVKHSLQKKKKTDINFRKGQEDDKSFLAEKKNASIQTINLSQNTAPSSVAKENDESPCKTISPSSLALASALCHSQTV